MAYHGGHYLEDYRCVICDTRHSLRFCRRFLALYPGERLRFVRQHKVCENCLGLSHKIEDCYSDHACKICWAGHHTLLHPVDDQAYEWLQMTALVWVHRPQIDEEKRIVRVLLDPNSQGSYFLPFNSFFPYKLTDTKKTLLVQLTDRHSAVRTLTVRLQPKIGPAPFTPHRHGLPTKVWDKYGKEDVADCSFYLPAACSIVLGNDVASDVYLGLVEEEKGLPYVQNTIFGQAFFGKIEVDQEGNRVEYEIYS